MGIKRYKADQDNTITNAYKPNLKTRATGSNMGLSDSLEVFRIYGQQNSGSSELSRILVQFPITDITTDRTNGVLPASGNVSFYLRMFNAEHPFTLPRNYNMIISTVSRAWDEGTGLDMESYSDSGSCNWMAAASASSGDTAWTTAGGDYQAEPRFTASFEEGTEDLEIDVSDAVERWIAGSRTNYGFGIRLENETALSSSYTKKFFARGSEFFFKRPVIEARWDSATRDDRGNFYFSSSLATSEDNLNTLYLYNHVRGRLRDIPDIGTGSIHVSIYSGSADNSEPTGSRIVKVVDGTHVITNNPYVVTGGHVSTGIYSASFALTAAANPLTTAFDVWHSGTTQFATSSFSPKKLESLAYNPYSKYVINITNLRDKYYRNETAQFRLYTRNKNWQPTIYTKASAVPENNLVESGSYKVVRLVDSKDVVPFGTGSDNHTQLSYDVSGSYFDLDIDMLEAGYGYGIKFAFYDDAAQSWNEYPDIFKFRVEE
jgi:hypothetical protein